MESREAVLLAPGAAPRFQALGNPWQILVSAQQTAGSLAVVQASFGPGGGAPAHRHAEHDECFYVLDGSFRFRIGDRTEHVGTGGFCHIPRTVAHGFDNDGEDEATILGIMSPGGFEQLFVELAALPPGVPEQAAVADVFSRYDQELA